MNTTLGWLLYFQQNARNRLEWRNSGEHLSPVEIDRISSSIQAFQLGEASEGRHLMDAANRHAEAAEDPYYPDCIRHLIREENRHSGYLAQFMKEQGIPLAKKKWSDRAFRAIRRFAGLELSIRTLVTAELVAITYYEALGTATSSVRLKEVCERMLLEEKVHIQFQMQRIHAINRTRFPLFAAMADIGHALLLAGTLGIVWLGHRRVLRARSGFREFCQRVWDDFRDAMDCGREHSQGREQSELESRESLNDVRRTEKMLRSWSVRLRFRPFLSGHAGHRLRDSTG